MKLSHKIVVGVFGALLLSGIWVSTHGADTTTPAPAATTSNAVAAPKPKKAQWELIVSQSSCQENPQRAYVNCSIGVRNRGASAGLPTVYADYRYSDSGESYDQSDNGQTHPSDPIPPRQIGWVYFSHPYNALQHDVIQVAVSLDPNAQSWPYVRVVVPSANWP